MAEIPVEHAADLADDAPSRVAIRNTTLVLALLAYTGLGVWLVVATLGGHADKVNGVQSAAFGALAVALGGGYAVFLGVAPKNAGLTEDAARRASVGPVVKKVASAKLTMALLVGGAFLYLLVGVGTCVAYGFKDAATPDVVKTVAIGFGGYVIAYVGTAYQKLSS